MTQRVVPFYTFTSRNLPLPLVPRPATRLGWSFLPNLALPSLVEFSEWMRERCNHPCVVIWDASNETQSAELAPAIRRVRGLDLSNRPWDNSYNPPMEPGDVFESHPYRFNKADFRLRDLATASPVPQGNALANE